MKIVVLYVTPEEEAKRLVLECAKVTSSLFETVADMIPERACNLPYFVMAYSEEERLPVIFDGRGKEVISRYEVL